jgi:hypothetical protein
MTHQALCLISGFYFTNSFFVGVHAMSLEKTLSSSSSELIRPTNTRILRISDSNPHTAAIFLYQYRLLYLRGGFSQCNVPSSERELLATFRAQISSHFETERIGNPELFTDERIMRFLRNNNMDVNKAKNAFNLMIRRRKELGADKIWQDVKRSWCEDFWKMNCIPKRDLFRKFYWFDPCVCVHNGELVSFEHTGKLRIRELMAQISETDLLTFFCYLMEWNLIKLSQISRKHKKLSRMIQIKDLDGISLYEASSKKAMDLFGAVNKMLHEVYPETLSRLVLIHTPSIFGILWRMFRGIIPKRTRSKMEVYSARHKSRSVLHSLTSSEELPWLPVQDNAPSASRLPGNSLLRSLFACCFCS